MAYDRYDTRDAPRDERSRWQGERFEGRDRGYSGREDRGFFERAGDEIASWFGDDDAERRRREDQRMMERERGYGYGGMRRGEERGRFFGRGSDWDRDRFERGYGYGGRERWSEPSSRGTFESDQSYSASGYGRGDYPRGGFSRDERASFAGSPDFSREYDPHYRSWRQRHMGELDRDYDDYRRENQARFESDFGSWRERRMQKRGLLGQIREQMEVVGNDDQHVGTVDRIAGDRIILTKSDPESGGVHHSLSCSDIDRVDADRVILDLDAEQAKQRWRDESRERALFEREDQGEMGPRMLGRSFEGTYR